MERIERIVEIFVPMTFRGMPTQYYVSDAGRIMSANGKIRKTHLNSGGYEQLHIRVNKKDYTAKVHQLVGDGFMDNPENKKTMNHIGEGREFRSYNDVINLERATQKEQVQDTIKKGTHVGAGKGELNRFANHTDNQVHEVCKLLEQNELTVDEISKITHVSKDAIHKIVSGKTWTHISCDYNISNYTIGRPYSDDIKNSMVEMYLEGIPFRKICERLNLPITNKIRCLYYQVKKKCKDKSSTTIEHENDKVMISDFGCEFVNIELSDDYYNIIIS